MPKGSNFSNASVSKLLRSVAAALAIKRANLFQIRAYENAADSIEHLTSEIKDLWQEGRLDQVPGIGASLQAYLDEYFKSGKVAHFKSLMEGIAPQTFEFLDISGVGPKTANELSKLGVKDKTDLREKLESGDLLKKGFSEKIAQKILLGLNEVSERSGRMLLPYASAQAEKILEYMRKSPAVKSIEPLGSLRRQVATVGDLDFAAASDEPKKVVEHFVNMPGVSRVLDHGENKANIILESGLEADLLVGDPKNYGALLQHFTGSKSHNIKLREIAQSKGWSLSEYGIRKGGRGKGESINFPCEREEELYNLLGMQTPPPEIRENTGEIEVALKNELPKLVEFEEIKGDLHLHSNFVLEPSHGPGLCSIEEIVNNAKEKRYEYVGISDHPPAFTTHTRAEIINLIKKRTKFIHKLKQDTKSIRVLNGLEVDILGNGSLSVPDEALESLDYCLAGIHSGHRGTKENITKRILTALQNRFLKVLVHPTGRLLGERESYDADWDGIFKFCAKNKKLLEINAYPNRLDLRDDLIRRAAGFGCKFIINTDAHQVGQMDNMPFGVSVAKRGWLKVEDVVNAWAFKDFAEFIAV